MFPQWIDQRVVVFILTLNKLRGICEQVPPSAGSALVTGVVLLAVAVTKRTKAPG